MHSSYIEAVKRNKIELGDQINTILTNIKSIKDDMLDLEVKISLGEPQERTRLQESLKMKSKNLNELSDSLVLISREAWKRFNSLTQLCEGLDGDPELLGSIRALCKDIDVIAADLLCFSLGY
jgi:hypothetical protein